MPNLDTAGALLHYVRTGHGPPVLLIQGVGAIGNAWRPQIEALGDRYTLVSFDNRGIGRSTIRDGRFTIEAMANDALAIMDVEGVDRFHVAGHSMGGVIAQALALSAPARVKSLAFLCTFARGKDGSSITLPMLGTAMRMASAHAHSDETPFSS
jgi:pimeloyl-ACP methyl ester carboxylesterase